MCDLLLSADVQGPTRVQYFIQNDPDGACQGHKISSCSPGPVKDEEMLARSIDFPLREDPASGLNDSLFQDAFTIGASTQRIDDDWDKSKSVVHARYEERARRRRSGEDGRSANPDWLYVGSVLFLASELRESQLDAVQRAGRIRIYDTAHSSDDPFHADVMVSADDLQTNKQLRKLLRVILMTKACKRGLFVSPSLAPDDQRLKNIKIELR
ncbi:hypothetical protein H8L32_05540 [Undibacterium sp. CY18W]|uniref:Uncharacterized protein n=1 Tax=Undibacterium hunanense TaxID=2762292 RepID=A0ABR6ZM19_9BURK|nr:hypothetical protein [Undibacterium hunanense]MBC3916932.1 hypothetical protein [Undibacterium hunanense]